MVSRFRREARRMLHSSPGSVVDLKGLKRYGKFLHYIARNLDQAQILVILIHHLHPIEAVPFILGGRRRNQLL